MKEPIDLEPLFPDRSSGEALGGQLVRRLRTAIENGFFPPASRLLPSRELAARLGVSRNTVTSALDQLTAEGYLEARVGSGTFVTNSLYEPPRPTPPRALEPPARSNHLAAIEARLTAVGSSLGPLRVGAPDLAAFPLRAWQRFERKNLTVFGTCLDYSESSGVFDLRNAIARHIAQFRGVVADPEQIVVVDGTQGALHLIAFAFARPGHDVAFEDPGYQYAAAIFSAHGLRLRGVPVDRDGMRTGDLPRGAALAYVTPSHQYPLGGALPLARRTELLEWARRERAYVIEDDYDSEFADRPLPALQSLDRGGRVIYVGTFSKTLAPGLRLGYVVAPRELVPALQFARSVAGRGVSEHLQQTAADFIGSGAFRRHVRRMTALYERRRSILIDVLARTLPASFSIGPAQAGLHVAISGPSDFDDVGLANGLSKTDRVLPLSLLCVERTDVRGVLAGFSAGSDENLAKAAALLAGALRSAARRGPV